MTQDLAMVTFYLTSIIRTTLSEMAFAILMLIKGKSFLNNPILCAPDFCLSLSCSSNIVSWIVLQKHLRKLRLECHSVYFPAKFGTTSLIRLAVMIYISISGFLLPVQQSFTNYSVFMFITRFISGNEILSRLKRDPINPRVPQADHYLRLSKVTPDFPYRFYLIV